MELKEPFTIDQLLEYLKITSQISSSVSSDSKSQVKLTPNSSSVIPKRDVHVYDGHLVYEPNKVYTPEEKKSSTEKLSLCLKYMSSNKEAVLALDMLNKISTDIAANYDSANKINTEDILAEIING